MRIGLIVLSSTTFIPHREGRALPLVEHFGQAHSEQGGKRFLMQVQVIGERELIPVSSCRWWNGKTLGVNE